ncbi:histidine phosphatase family protein [Pararhizobium antarcticum]|uniref:Histidine phosphatase family protein n=1 Tax=Pararhizobium antarcticum TaxID=1798805 RepID=A0A657LM15_9HYPH|nr:histidine phosphatase family protein [Pararhizobium antarcticum]OJF90563.1 histidine phosphatase family protein [Pararhizobium antarcticum]OJF98639.1 histidine phosphatase family protein [Rhizobium sp. 58]
MYAIYLTHPQIRMEPDKPVPKWSVSALGRSRAVKAAALPWASSLRRIVSSDETKALETAEILAGASGVSLQTLQGSGENDRSATGFLLPEAFEAAADRFFADPEQSFMGWERAVDAQARIVAAVTGVLEIHDPALPIAFIGHGGVGTLLKCHLMGKPISRTQDQPAGGGNLFAFGLADRALACDWTPMEDWQGWELWQGWQQ